jgi:hypothetical protein
LQPKVRVDGEALHQKLEARVKALVALGEQERLTRPLVSCVHGYSLLRQYRPCGIVTAENQDSMFSHLPPSIIPHVMHHWRPHGLALTLPLSAFLPLPHSQTRITIQKEVGLGEEWRICGEAPELGRFVMEIAPRMTWSQGHVWKYEGRLPAGG